MDWGETYEGGSAEAEHLAFKALADDIMHAQLKARRAAGEKTLVVAVDRAFHAKALLAVANAELHFRPDLPTDLAAGFGRETLPFKNDVRKLKNLGLTESLEVGYRLSLRGEAYVAATTRTSTR